MNSTTNTSNQTNSSNQAVIQVDSVTYTYKRSASPALNNVSFQLQNGELLGIAGPNGCGKTTLIKHLNGLFKAQSGQVLLHGEPVSKPKDLTKSVGIVFQNPDEQIFFPTVREDISFGPANLGLSKEEVNSRVHEALHALDIEHLIDRTFFSLSFGEKKKVAIAGVLAMRPKVIVLDEPTIGLDPWSKESFLDLILSLKANHSLIVATHDFDLLRIVDRTLMLWKGEVLGEYTTFEDFHTKVVQMEK